MTDDALFGFTEVRLGLAPAVISVVVLPKLRRADAAELFLTGRRIPAAKAAEVGLVNRAVPAAEVDSVVDALVEELVAGGPHALAASKGLIAEVPDMEPPFDGTEPIFGVPLPTLGHSLHAPTAAMLFQFREVALRGASTRVAHLAQPRFAWS